MLLLGHAHLVNIRDYANDRLPPELPIMPVIFDLNRNCPPRK